MLREIRKIGGSYGITLPKDLIEFYKFENTLVSVKVTSREIILRKVDGLKAEKVKDFPEVKVND